MSDPTECQKVILQAVAAEGGYGAAVNNIQDAEACCRAGWLIAEDYTGYALTVDGKALMRRLF